MSARLTEAQFGGVGASASPLPGASQSAQGALRPLPVAWGVYRLGSKVKVAEAVAL